MSSDTLLVGSGLPSDEAEDDRFHVRSRLEVIGLLRALVDKSEFATIYFGTPADFVVSMVLAVNPQADEVTLDVGADAAANDRMLRAGPVLVVSHLDHIRIQFEAAAVQPITFDDKPALRVRLPALVIRVQRRDDFRVRLPHSGSVRFEVPAGAGGKRVNLRIVDLSCGGIGLAEVPAQLRCENGANWPACRLIMREEGTIEVNVAIVRVLESSKSGDVVTRRVGARFVGMPDRARSQLQRFINRMERERLSKE